MTLSKSPNHLVTFFSFENAYIHVQFSVGRLDDSTGIGICGQADHLILIPRTLILKRENYTPLCLLPLKKIDSKWALNTKISEKNPDVLIVLELVSWLRPRYLLPS